MINGAYRFAHAGSPEKSGIILLFAAVLLISLSACQNEPSEANAALRGIIVSKQPLRLIYGRGAAFDSTGILVTAYYSNNAAIPVSGYTLSWGDAVIEDGDTGVTADIGSKTINVVYQNMQADFSILVQESIELQRIEITNPPDKTAFYVNEHYDYTGMIVTAVYSDGRRAEVSGYTLSWNGLPLTAGNNDITSEAGNNKLIVVNYQDKTAELNIDVKARNFAGLDVKRLPFGDPFRVGEPFDANGLIVNAVYDDGSEIPIVDYNLYFIPWSDPPLDYGDTEVTATPGTKSIMIYAYCFGGGNVPGITTTFNITVIP